MSKDRIIELQKQLKIARDTLTRIANGHIRSDPGAMAQEALDKIWPLDQKQQLQGLLGHDTRLR